MEQNIHCPPSSVEVVDTDNPMIKHVFYDRRLVAELGLERGAWRCHFRADAPVLYELDEFRTRLISPVLDRLNLLYNVTKRLAK